LFHRVRQQVGFGEAGGVVFLAYVFHGVSLGNSVMREL
jgi:hypothetical protein